MEKLKPCPFCGYVSEYDDESGIMYCNKCATAGPIPAMQDTKEWHIKNWNTRPIEDAQSAKIAQLEKALFETYETVVELGYVWEMNRDEIDKSRWHCNDCGTWDYGSHKKESLNQCSFHHAADCKVERISEHLTAHYMQKAKEATNG